MKRMSWRIKGFVIVGLAALLAIGLVVTAPQHAVALVRVVNATGQPIAGAVVSPQGLRTKPGPYVSGWYGWRKEVNGVPNPPVTTDADGYARVPYPKYVFERIETGTLCLSVSHADYVPDRPERVVATAPPAGAPWRERLAYVWAWLRRQGLIARPDPIVLQNGSQLSITVPAKGAPTNPKGIFAQVSGEPYGVKDFWRQPTPGVITTRQLAPGAHLVRAVVFDAQGAAWFSDVVAFKAAPDQTNDLELPVKRGVTLRGRLGENVPRPVRHGRVSVHVTPPGTKLQETPPQWHAWAPVAADGTFTVESLPEGDLEITALCEGFLSRNGPGQFQMRYPQRHRLDADHPEISLDMEPTVRLEVTVTGERGQPLPGVRVMTWPNVRYGEWSATILMSDCYNTSDRLLHPEAEAKWGQTVPDFEGVSDQAGVAVLPNLPPDVTSLAVEHPGYTLPAIGSAANGMRRQKDFQLSVGGTNRLSIQLEPIGRSKISHY